MRNMATKDEGMDIQVLANRPNDAFLGQDLCRIIGAIGTSRFEDALFETARDAMRCTHLTAFAASPGRPPKVLVAANVGDAPTARALAQTYIEKYWMEDPANQSLGSDPRIGGGATLRLHAHEIGNLEYRRDCYRNVDLIDRLSVVKAVGGDMLRLNFYRETTQGRFSDADLRLMQACADLLIQVIAKHDALRPAQGREAEYERRRKTLSLSAPHLSPREVQVCAEIVSGMSSESIAAKLDLSINTVLSHRRRAYAKLKISSQSELSRLVLQ